MKTINEIKKTLNTRDLYHLTDKIKINQTSIWIAGAYRKVGCFILKRPFLICFDFERIDSIFILNPQDQQVTPVFPDSCAYESIFPICSGKRIDITNENGAWNDSLEALFTEINQEINVVKSKKAKDEALRLEQLNLERNQELDLANIIASAV